MATSKSKEGGVNIRYDAFIKQVRPDASNTDPVAILHGYIGESGSDDKIRLYADESLSEYADILKTDILYAVPDEENPLGGSRLWVKQSAEVNHTDANAFAQGDMYNAYMGNMYEGGAANMGGAAAAATALCTAPLTRTIICRPTRFVCPTPASRLIICNRITQTGPGCQLVSFGPACPKPSWVDGCPSALGCTIGTTVINPGRGAGFANAAGGYGDYTGGDMYNDYMANSYDAGGATGEFGGAATTTVCAASIPAWRCPPVLHTLNIVRCGFSYQVDCLRPSVLSFCVTQQRNVCSRHICNQQACQLGSIRVPIQSIACATDITRPATNVVNPGAGFADAAGGYGDYTGGDMYNDYMANSYDAGATGEFGGGLTNPAICNNPVSLTIICNKPSLLTQCRSLQILCITRNTPHCPIGCQFGSIRVPIKTLACATDFTRPVFNTTRQAGPVQSVDYCRTDLCPSNFCPDRAINPAVNPGVVGGFADAYGGYGDYSGGDMYNDYMANSYDAGATGEFGGGAITQACTIQPTTPVICQQTIVCPASVPVWRCPINTLPPRCPVYSLPPRCPIFTRPPRCPITCAFGTRPVTINCPSFAGCPTQACPDTLTQPGNINPGAGFADAAGYGDYSGGDMYNDYMANSYEASTAGATGEFGGAAPAISINPVQCGFASQLCPSLVPVRCRTLLPLNSICCRPTMPNNTQCCLTRPSLCCTRPPVTPCGQTTNPVMCRQTILC